MNYAQQSPGVLPPQSPGSLLVYIMHPLSARNPAPWNDRAANVARYLRFVAAAMMEGHTVATWIHHEILIGPGVRPFGLSLEEHEILEHDFRLLRVSDIVWQCAPLNVSQGMTLEFNEAIVHGIPIRCDVEWMDFHWNPVFHRVKE